MSGDSGAVRPTRQYMDDQLQKIEDAQEMTVYCALCPEWELTTTAKKARAASQTHRSTEHPELTNKKKVVRPKRAFSTAMTAEREAQIDEERRQRMRALGLG
jgi:hypothetical protein